MGPAPSLYVSLSRKRVTIVPYANSDSGREIMDEKQQKQVNEAAEKFADALKESYQSIADRSVSAQELNAQVTQDFFNGVINNLRTQAENNRALSEDLIEHHRKQQEASQALAQE
jgi:polyhydroxyalkanoate synthesis regulator phasin